MSQPLPGTPGWPWPWPWPGGEEPTPPEPTIYYLRYAEGHLGQVTVTGPEPVIPEGATLLTQEQYEQERGLMLQAHQERLDQLQAEEAAARLAQYEELKAVGLSEPTARSLSGYDGPQTETQTAG